MDQPDHFCLKLINEQFSLLITPKQMSICLWLDISCREYGDACILIFFNNKLRIF